MFHHNAKVNVHGTSSGASDGVMTTTHNEDEIFNYISVTLSVALSIITILLNGFCIDVVRRSKSLLRKPSTVFILNLLVLQLIQGLLVLPLYVVRKANIQGDEHWTIRICNGFRFSYTVTFFGTCLGVLLTSIDRFFAVYWIASYRIRFTRPRVMLFLFLKWVYVMVLCTLPLFRISQAEKDDITLACTTNSMEAILCDYRPSKLWSLFMLIVNTALPYVIIVAVYFYVIRTVKFFEKRVHHKSSKFLEVPTENQRVVKIKKKDLTKHKKITKLAILLCFIYALLWIPSVIYYAVKHICPDCFQGFSCRNSDYIDFVIKFVAFLNGIAVPVVYCFYQKDFRRTAGNNVRNSLWNSVKSSISDIEKIKLLSEDTL